jgi:hypothetical protein
MVMGRSVLPQRGGEAEWAEIEFGGGLVGGWEEIEEGLGGMVFAVGAPCWWVGNLRGCGCSLFYTRCLDGGMVSRMCRK